MSDPIHYTSSIIKINKDGQQVISSTLEPGERLVSGETYEDLQGTPNNVPVVPEPDTSVPAGTGLTLNEAGNGTAPADAAVVVETDDSKSEAFANQNISGSDENADDETTADDETPAEAVEIVTGPEDTTDTTKSTKK